MRDVLTVNSDLQMLVGSDAVHECSLEWKERLGVPDADILAVEPASEEDAAAILQFAAEKGYTVLPIGSGTQLHIGEAPASVDLLISSRRLSGIVEHTAGDLTVTVRAGTPFSEVQSYLKQHGQFVPITPPASADATIGGLVATAAAGPERVLYGSWRDNVIGLRAVLPNGQVIRTGGKVVKNVAGYDMNKLLVGSHGTLAFLTEITLKLKPFPKHRELVLAQRADLHSIVLLAERILASECVPSALELVTSGLNDSAYKEVVNADGITPGMMNPGFILAIGCDEVEAAAGYQANRIRELALDLGSDVHFTRLVGEEVEQFWNNYRLTWKQAAPEALLLRGAVPIPLFAETMSQLQNQAAKLGVHCSIAAGLGTGTYRLQISANESQKLIEVSAYLREISAARGGYLIVEDGDHQLKKAIGVWGKPGGGELLMKGIKQTVDPGALFTAGRFAGGI